MFIPTKKELETVPFEKIFEEGMNDHTQKKALARNSAWILPQALAYIGNNWKPVRIGDKYSGTDTAKAGIASCSLGSEWAKGLLLFLLASPRGTIFPQTLKATSEELLPYSALVPLFMAAYKKYCNIPYSSWENINTLVDKDLYSAMSVAVPEFTVDELLSIRESGCTVKSGKTAGEIRNPIKATTISSTGVLEFDNLPRLSKIMLTQCWIAHPSLRNQYMILNPNNWDDMPKPLINVDISNKIPDSNVPDWM